MKEMILKRMQILEDLSHEFNQLKETYDGMLEDDPRYQEFQEEDQKIKEKTKEQKAQILDKSAYTVIKEDLKEKRQQIKENKEAMAQELVEYYKSEGKLEIVDHEGNVKRMKFSVRLVN